jgi:hypothetical protein
MDWTSLLLSLELAAATLLLLLPAGLWLARWLAKSSFRAKALVEAAVVLPLVLPPTVLGYYLLVSRGAGSTLGRWMLESFDVRLTFNFLGLLIASVIFNIPFIVQPVQRAFEDTRGAEYAFELAGGTYALWLRVRVPSVFGPLLGGSRSDAAWVSVADGEPMVVGEDLVPDAWTWVPKLPQTDTGALKQSDELLVLTVTREGKLFLDEFPVEVGGLADKLAGITSRKPDTKVYLRADKDVPYGVVVQVMAEARKAGIANLGMVTEPEKVPPPTKKKAS